MASRRGLTDALRRPSGDLKVSLRSAHSSGPLRSNPGFSSPLNEDLYIKKPSLNERRAVPKMASRRGRDSEMSYVVVIERKKKVSKLV